MRIMDMIARYAASKSWTLRPNIVLVEGTSDEALFRRADELSRLAGQVLLGDNISIVAAGRGDQGGTFGVARELIALRSYAPLVLDKRGFLAYRIVALVDNDHAGRQIIQDVTRLDRSAVEFQDIVALRPVIPKFIKTDPLSRQHECNLANLPYGMMDWEIEDTLSPKLIAKFEKANPDIIVERTVNRDKIHYNLEDSAKAVLHLFVQREAALEDLSGVVEIVHMLRAILGLPSCT
ncbi:hypothetical+protein [Methylocapsa aurea]|uniref:hypothetical protein n=1 Tax=Methylocapsa aurea TaxID=663610 RepID=UPI003D18CF75